MIVQRSLFEEHPESGKDHVSERGALKTTRHDEKLIAVRNPRGEKRATYWRLVGSTWQTIVFLTQLYTCLDKIIGTFGSTGKAWWGQNSALMTGSMAVITTVAVLATPTTVLLEKLYRLVVGVVEKKKGMIKG